MTHCVEIIAFTIRPERLAEFAAIKSQVASEARQLPGLITSTTQHSLVSRGDFVDIMVWESQRAAVAGTAAFERLPSAPAFMAMMASPPTFQGRFAWSAGDEVLRLRSDEKVQ
ncbi:MAG TPA: hypothetical protein ENK43_05650 [Planctomycetes bacterium]|nr:hypothetical protein [Planctomycetota bacterium]